jgi:hypothetical protein
LASRSSSQRTSTLSIQAHRTREIFKMFRRDLRFGTEVSSVLTSLTTFDGHLPQGAATSPALANALFAVMLDRPLAAHARRIGVKYSRYVDDLTFSGPRARELLPEVAARLSVLGLKLARNRRKLNKIKLKVTPRDEPQIVTGLVVNESRAASVGQKQIDRVRAAIHQLPRMSTTERPLSIQSIKGRISYVRQFHKGAARRLQKQFDRLAKNLSTETQRELPAKHTLGWNG